jgi:hypothetical protein
VSQGGLYFPLCPVYCVLRTVRWHCPLYLYCFLCPDTFASELGASLKSSHQSSSLSSSNRSGISSSDANARKILHSLRYFAVRVWALGCISFALTHSESQRIPSHPLSSSNRSVSPLLARVWALGCFCTCVCTEIPTPLLTLISRSRRCAWRSSLGSRDAFARVFPLR